MKQYLVKVRTTLVDGTYGIDNEVRDALDLNDLLDKVERKRKMSVGFATLESIVYVIDLDNWPLTNDDLWL